MTDDAPDPTNGQPSEAPKPRRVILTYEGDNLQIAAEQCSPILVEATLLRGLAFIQRELLVMRLNEEGARQAKMRVDAEKIRGIVERGR